MSEAKTRGDGLAVLGVLIEAGSPFKFYYFNIQRFFYTLTLILYFFAFRQVRKLIMHIAVFSTTWVGSNTQVCV